MEVSFKMVKCFSTLNEVLLYDVVDKKGLIIPSLFQNMTVLEFKEKRRKRKNGTKQRLKYLSGP